MPTIAEILEQQGMRSDPSTNCAAGKIPFSRFLRRECYLPCHELKLQEAKQLDEDLKTHVLQKGFRDLCTNCQDRIINHSQVLFHFNKF